MAGARIRRRSTTSNPARRPPDQASSPTHDTNPFGSLYVHSACRKVTPTILHGTPRPRPCACQRLHAGAHCDFEPRRDQIRPHHPFMDSAKPALVTCWQVRASGVVPLRPTPRHAPPHGMSCVQEYAGLSCWQGFSRNLAPLIDTPCHFPMNLAPLREKPCHFPCTSPTQRGGRRGFTTPREDVGGSFSIRHRTHP